MEANKSNLVDRKNNQGIQYYKQQRNSGTKAYIFFLHNLRAKLSNLLCAFLIMPYITVNEG